MCIRDRCVREDWANEIEEVEKEEMAVSEGAGEGDAHCRACCRVCCAGCDDALHVVR